MGLFVSIRRVQVDTGYVGEVVRRAQTGFVPLLRGLQGFLGYELVDAGGGGLASITSFDNRASAEASARVAEEWVARNIQAWVLGPPTAITGEVAFRTEAPAMAAERHIAPPMAGFE